MPTPARFRRVLPSEYDRLSPLADEVSGLLGIAAVNILPTAAAKLEMPCLGGIGRSL